MAVKTIKLNGGAIVPRLALLAAGALCILAVYFTVKWCLAGTLAENAPNKEVAELAVEWAPGNPRAHHSLAVFREKTFLAEDFARSLEDYERAAALSPNDYRMWFDLGKARDRNGDAEGAKKAYRKAIELAPNYSRLHWALGNLLLRQGSSEEAFLEIRRAVENDPALASPAVTVAWNFFDADVSLISQKIGDSMPIRSAMSAFLAAEKRYDEAFVFWNALSPEDKQSIYKTDGERLLQALLATKRYRDALAVQMQIAPGEGEKFEPGRIFNGGFEADVRRTGASFFDWTIAEGMQPQIAFDESQKHGGKRSLVMLFNSPTGQEFRSVQQNAVVEGGKRYAFSAFFRSDLKTQGTLRWEIADTGDGKILAATEAVPNSSDWSPLTAELTTPPATEAVTIRLARVPCPPAAGLTVCPIQGKVWFDDFSLKKSE
jgi:hypothetical protein